MKKVLVDSNFLIYLIDVNEDSPEEKIKNKKKVQYFLREIISNKGIIVIPTTSIAEYLYNARDAGLEIIGRLSSNKSIIIAPFDKRTAYTCAEIHRNAAEIGGKRYPAIDSTWQKIKTDWQVVATAKSNGCDLIVSSDKDIRRMAETSSINYQSIDEISIIEDAQYNLPYIHETRDMVVSKFTGGF